MVTIQVDDITKRILQPKIDAPQGSFRDIQIVVATFRIIEQHIIVLKTNGNIFDNGITAKSWNSIVTQTRGGQIQISGGVQI